jgi:hypothetical protein
MRLNSSGELVVTTFGSTVGPFPGVESQDPFCSGDFRRTLFGPSSLVVSEISPLVFFETETVPLNTTYHFTVPSEMAHLTNTTSVQTGFTAVGLAPINT